MDINQLRQKAKVLGFTFEKGPQKYSGYVLIDPDGGYPLGRDHTASLSDIEKRLDNLADDIDVEQEDIEAGDDEGSKGAKELSAADVNKAVRGHKDADLIKAAWDPPKPTLEEKRDRLRLEHLESTYNSPGGRIAWGRLSEAEQAEHIAKARALRAKVEKAEAARLQPPKSAIPLRTHALNSDNPLWQETARLSRKFRAADRQLFRTNIRSRQDRDADGDAPGDYPDDVFLRPEAGDDFLEVKSVTSVSTISVKRRLSKADLAEGRRLLDLASHIRAAIAGDDKAAAGAMLREVKGLLDHGQFGDWVTKEVRISASSAERYMKKAPLKGS